MPARWLVYVLRCRDGSLYTGITTDLAKRLRAHAAGKASRYTRSRLPVRPVYAEPQATKSLALKREAAIKALSRLQKLRLVAGSTAGRRPPSELARGHRSRRRGPEAGHHERPRAPDRRSGIRRKSNPGIMGQGPWNRLASAGLPNHQRDTETPSRP